MTKILSWGWKGLFGNPWGFRRFEMTINFLSRLGSSPVSLLWDLALDIDDPLFPNDRAFDDKLGAVLRLE